ncbi:MAG: DUF5674 family protein [Pyrinomonadaceae bacterium MAG19_C2-C3]|nr:DUF5674 family protein [Pyrinomonadaceae bacterium MAG19_C2-C3]
MILLIKEQATPEQLTEMLQPLGSYIKLAVDTKRKIIAGGGLLHADCEAVLLEDGSRQADIWGASWLPFSQTVSYESLINIRPRQNNRSMEIEDRTIRYSVEETVKRLLEGVGYE